MFSCFLASKYLVKLVMVMPRISLVVMYSIGIWL